MEPVGDLVLPCNTFRMLVCGSVLEQDTSKPQPRTGETQGIHEIKELSP